MTDIHCHILPCVDDGAETTDEALELLRSEIEQGVDTVCLTPHLRKKMFISSDETIKKAFEKLKAAAAAAELPVELYLSREYHYDSGLLEKLESGELLPMGQERVLLVEFANLTTYREMLEAVRFVQSCGYKPLIAHVERYAAVQKSPDSIGALIKQGALIQINADSVIGRCGLVMKFTCRYLLKHDMVNVVASDAHDTQMRAVRMKDCEAYISKHYGSEKAEQLLNTAPLSILN